MQVTFQFQRHQSFLYSVYYTFFINLYLILYHKSSWRIFLFSALTLSVPYLRHDGKHQRIESHVLNVNTKKKKKQKPYYNWEGSASLLRQLDYIHHFLAMLRIKEVSKVQTLWFFLSNNTEPCCNRRSPYPQCGDRIASHYSINSNCKIILGL